jgi:hypothetical protein
MEEVQKADPAARKKAVLLLLIFAVLGAGSFYIVEATKYDLADWVETNATAILNDLKIIAVALVVLFTPVYLALYHFFSLGSRIARTQRFPPPGLAVIRDTKIITGDTAILRGRILQILSVTIALMTIVTIFMALRALNGIATAS